MADELIFLGTAGGRMSVAKQLRASGGFWAVLGGTRLHVDPGPGALVHCHAKALKLDPTTLSAILLTHKHLDHAGDVNAMIEAMTEGGTKKRGRVLAPRDAYEDDPVIFRYVRSYPEKTEVLVEGGVYQLGALRIETPLRLKHPVETYGLRLVGPDLTVSLIACTGYFPAIEQAYAGDVLILNVVFLPRRDDSHLCLEDAERLIAAIRPRLAILTHFGMTMVRGKPWELADRVSQATGIKTLAARDHQRLDLAKALAPG
ncbi:MAG: MBL fold metallo-hydrolase [Candidatus Rokubacteria bacterium]|nr:MBL fold metallo-hydrolase [Candidatus Rokubacteria bacterium]